MVLCFECCNELRHIDSEVQFKLLRPAEEIQPTCERCDMLLKKAVRDLDTE